MKKAKKNIILNNKDKSYDELFKLIQDDEEAKVKVLLETRGVKNRLKLLSENNKLENINPDLKRYNTNIIVP